MDAGAQVDSSGSAVNIPIPPGQSPWSLAAAATGFLVDEFAARVTEIHDLTDGTICIDLKLTVGTQGENE
jgi:hypothetical protein